MKTVCVHIGLLPEQTNLFVFLHTKHSNIIPNFPQLLIEKPKLTSPHTLFFTKGQPKDKQKRIF